ncbi:MAG TPA: EspA/EspE family type VII secretion system effector [Mycobacterium sp.]|nr:EspA/EspE family type VII secretion system effector [Mycobacterium sp.]
MLDAFLSTWSNARSTFGEGTPETGAQYDKSGPLRDMQTTVQSAAPGSKWTGGAAGAYGTANTNHSEVFGKLAGLDQRLSAQVDQSSQVVDAGRRNLDSLRQWVVDAAASVPPGKNRDQMLLPIVQKGLRQLSDIVTKSNGDMNKIGGRIRALDSEFQSLGNQKFGKSSIQAVTDIKTAGPFNPPVETEVERSPLTPGRPADPTDPFVGDPNFGQWETVSTSPTGPYPPVKSEYRPFLEDIPLKIGPTTGMYVPGQTWIADEDAPIVQYKEGYRFRIAGTEATDITRVVNVNGETQVQRWVGNVYEYQRNTSTVPGGDLGGLPPIQNIDHNWKPISLPEIATLSANNSGTTYYLPDGCGGTVDFVGGVVEGNGPPRTPIMTRPR